MDCPVCKNLMITLELDEVEIDHCLDCGGIWLDSGELEQLIGNALYELSHHEDAKGRDQLRDRDAYKRVVQAQIDYCDVERDNDDRKRNHHRGQQDHEQLFLAPEVVLGKDVAGGR